MSSDVTRSLPPEVTRTGDPDATVGPPEIPGAVPAAEWTEVGRGAMGVVYKATQPGLNRAVAVKMLLGDDAPRHALRFLAEAEAVAAVDHPHVVKVYEFGRRDGRPFLAMEYLPGGTLADRFAAGPLPLSDIATLLRKIALGVGAAHAAGVVHRDLKPANVLFDAAGEPKVTDFGLAKRGGGADLTHTQAVLGTPAYMSPEQAKGDTKFVGPPADVWALGVILYEALTGARPFAAADTWGMLHAVQHTDPTDVRSLRREIPRDLSVIVAKCLRKEPAERYPTANELAADLGRFLAGESIQARPPGSVERAIKWAQRKPAVAAGWALGVIAAVALAVAGITLKLKADADAARHHAEVSEGEAKQARDAEKVAREQVEQAREKLARAGYARTINLAHREYQRNDLKRADEYLKLCREDLRGWEWHYVHRLCHSEWEIIPEQLASTEQPFTGDGRTFLTLNGGEVNVRHVEKGLIRTLDAGKETRWATISPDGSTVATGDGIECRLWRVSSGERVRRLRHEQSIRSATFSADGQELFAVLEPPPPKPLTDKQLDALTRPGTPPADPKPEKTPESAYTLAAVWPLTGTGTAPKAEWRIDPNFGTDRPDAVKVPGIEVTKLDLKGVAYTSGGRLVRLADGRLVQGGWLLGDAWVWSADGRTSAPLPSVREVFAVSPTPGLLIAHDKGTLSGVDTATGKPVWSLPLGASQAAVLDAHPDGDWVGVGCDDGRVEVWSVKGKERVGEFHGFSRGHVVTACRVSSDRRWVVAGSCDVTRVWRTDRSAEASTVSVPLSAKFMTVRLQTVGENPRTVFKFDNTALRVMSEGSLFGPPEWADLYRRTEGLQALRERTAARRFGPNAIFSHDRSVLYYVGLRWSEGTPARQREREQIGQFEPFFATACHDAEDLFAVWDSLRQHEVTIRAFGENQPARTFDAGGTVKAAAFARTGHVLYVATDNGTLSAWDADTLRRLWQVRCGGEYSTLCVDVSPDGKRLAAGGADDTVLVLDASTGAVVNTLRGHTRKPQAVRFSPDGNRLASHAGREVKVWDPDTGQELLTFGCRDCDCLDFSPDGTRLIAASVVGFASIGFAMQADLKSVGVPLFGVRLTADRLFTVDISFNSHGNTLTEREYDSSPIRGVR